MADPGLSSKELKELKELRIFNPYWAPKIGDMPVIIIWRVPNQCLTALWAEMVGEAQNLTGNIMSGLVPVC